MISSVSSVRSLERYIFSSCRNSSREYASHSEYSLTMKCAIRSAMGRSIATKFLMSSSA